MISDNRKFWENSILSFIRSVLSQRSDNGCAVSDSQSGFIRQKITEERKYVYESHIAEKIFHP